MIAKKENKPNIAGSSELKLGYIRECWSLAFFCIHNPEARAGRGGPRQALQANQNTPGMGAVTCSRHVYKRHALAAPAPEAEGDG